MSAMITLSSLHWAPRFTAENWAGKLWSSVAAIVLGVVLARWTWVLLAPASMAVLPPAEITGSEAAGNLFGVAVSSVAGASAVVLPGARLVGVFAPIDTKSPAAKGQDGFAVLQLDEKHQAGVALGAEVAPGVKLREIYADHVVLERDGLTQRVNLDGVKLKENPATEFVAKPSSLTSGPATAIPAMETSQAPANFPPMAMPGGANQFELQRQMRAGGPH